jgi:hypothetical protein
MIDFVFGEHVKNNDSNKILINKSAINIIFPIFGYEYKKQIIGPLTIKKLYKILTQFNYKKLNKKEFNYFRPYLKDSYIKKLPDKIYLYHILNGLVFHKLIKKNNIYYITTSS